MNFKLHTGVSSPNHVQLGFGVVILLLVFVASAVLYQTYRTNEIVTNLVEVNNAKIKHVIGMREAIRFRVISVSNILATNDEFERDEEIMRFYSYATKYVIARDMLLALPMNETEKALHKQLSEAIRASQPFTTSLVEKAGDHEPLAVLKQLEKKSHSIREGLFRNLNELVRIQQEQGQQALAKIRTVNNEARSVILSITILVLILSFTIATIVSRMVANKNKQLVDAYENAQAATRSKSVFLANMSHEIRTPITAIIGFAESTFFSNQSMEMRQKSVKTIIESGKHLLQLINNVLDISKIEANMLNVEIVSTPLSRVITGAELIVKPLAEEKSLEFKVNYHYPLPAMLETDPLRLKQIIINLCSNAIKFTQQGSVQVNISYKKESHKLLIEVIDTGIGLSKDQIKTIFDPFNQADSNVNRKYGGTGLGLTLSKQLAGAMHGKIEVSSEPGKGSRFTLVMDIGEITDEQLTYEADDSASKNGVEKEIEDIAAIDKLRVAGKVLVVEDNIVNQQLLRVFLTRVDVDYEVVENGQLAVERAQAEDFDLILMDIQMPVMDGITATKILRELGYDKPIVALTANSSEEDQQNCFDAGCDDFLTKPIDIKSFFEVITDHLHGYSKVSDTKEPIYSAFTLQDPEMTKRVEGFVKLHMPEFLRDIEQAIHRQDWESLKHKLNELNGTAANVGYLALMDIAKQMEFQVLNESPVELKLLFDKLTTIANRISLGINSALIQNAADSAG